MAAARELRLLPRVRPDALAIPNGTAVVTVVACSSSMVFQRSKIWVMKFKTWRNENSDPLLVLVVVGSVISYVSEDVVSIMFEQHNGN